MKPLREFFNDARDGGWAVGHFNFATADVLRAIVQGAKAGGAPCVMVGTSEGEADFLGMAQAVALVGAVRQAADFPVFLNADHFRSFEKCKEAVDMGYDTVLFDGGKLTYIDNMATAQRVWQYAQTARGGMMIEGELGYLKGSSEVQKAVTIGPQDYTRPDQAADFVAKTGVERLAIVCGNIHGIVTEQEEHLDIGHIQKIAAAVPKTYLVLHGASGVSDSEVSAAIKAGITNVHFNTELRVAYQEGIKEQIAREPDQTTPYKLLAHATEKVQALVEQKIRLFMNP